MKKFDLDKFKNYVNTYDKQPGHEDYSVETIINDFLYGIGICLDEDKFSFSNGFDEFKKMLIKHIEGEPKQERRTKCWCGNPINEDNPDCVAFNLCKDHATDA